METKKVILVPDDFSEVSNTAIAHAVVIAKKDQDKLILLHVLNDESKADLKKQQKEIQSLLQDMEKRARSIAEAHQIEVSAVLKEGSIYNTIGPEAEAIGASLIVMGTHGVKGMQHITGARALKVVAGCKIPLIIVQKKGPANNGYGTLVLPIDHSIEAKQKTLQAITFSKIFGSKIYLFQQNSRDEEKLKNIKNNINFICRQFDSHNVKYEISVQTNHKDFEKDFIAYAKNQSADLIIILSTASKDILDSVLGPVEQFVINNEAQIPVMIINPKHNLYTSKSLTSVALFS